MRIRMRSFEKPAKEFLPVYNLFQRMSETARLGCKGNRVKGTGSQIDDSKAPRLYSAARANKEVIHDPALPGLQTMRYLTQFGEFSPLYLLELAFTIWMLVDARRRGMDFY